MHLLLRAFWFFLIPGLLLAFYLLALGSFTAPRPQGLRPAVSAQSRLIIFVGVAWCIGISLWFMTWVGNGIDARPLLATLLPTSIAVVPITTRDARTFVQRCGFAALLMAAFSFVSGFSIGAAYAPLTLLISLAGIIAARRL